LGRDDIESYRVYSHLSAGELYTSDTGQHLVYIGIDPEDSTEPRSFSRYDACIFYCSPPNYDIANVGAIWCKEFYPASC
jgi:hypothetical protein